MLKEEEEAWPEVQEEMNRSLATMRVDYDQVCWCLQLWKKPRIRKIYFWILGGFEISSSLK